MFCFILVVFFYRYYRNGSVVADMTIILSKDLSSPLTELVEGAKADGKIGNMTVEPSSIKLFDEGEHTLKIIFGMYSRCLQMKFKVRCRKFEFQH